MGPYFLSPASLPCYGMVGMVSSMLNFTEVADFAVLAYLQRRGQKSIFRVCCSDIYAYTMGCVVIPEMILIPCGRAGLYY